MWTRIIFSLLALIAADTQAPWFGVWKQNPARSTINPETRFKRVTLKIEPWEDGLKVSYDMIGTRGGITHLEWTGKFDGKDYAVQGLDYVLTNAYTRADDNSYRILVKMDGAPAARADVSISPDGKTLTSVTTQKDGRGQDTSTTAVYERQ